MPGERETPARLCSNSAALWCSFLGSSARNPDLYRHFGYLLHRPGGHFDASELNTYPPGIVIVLLGNTSHFHWAKSSKYITQLTGIGSLDLECVNSKDDPRVEEPPCDQCFRSSLTRPRCPARSRMRVSRGIQPQSAGWHFVVCAVSPKSGAF